MRCEPISMTSCFISPRALTTFSISFCVGRIKSRFKPLRSLTIFTTRDSIDSERFKRKRRLVGFEPLVCFIRGLPTEGLIAFVKVGSTAANIDA